MTTLAPEPTVTAPDSGDALTHVVCCNDDVALCGTDVAGQEWVDDDEDPTCVVCRELADAPCPVCGL
ncbi:hypothetical protein AB0D27_11260 [Streptomyces sp. NPDC048415]|uniref:hypothetical protein n=1 Tax=Streptomyces sp. NPDC048415 TaxID=3154822 RepID=UPI0034458B32